MRWLTSLTSLLVVVAALFHSGPQQAWACLCAYAEVSDASEVYEAYDALVIVRVDGGERRLRVERTFKGVTGDEILFAERQAISSCDYPALIAGSQHFLALEADGDGTYRRPWMCSSFSLSRPEPLPGADDRSEFVAAIEREAVAHGTLRLRDPGEGGRARTILMYVGLSAAIIAAGAFVALRVSRRRSLR